ncbi:MAG: acylneuraminate cytidylyltransferase family protein [Oligoflexales bacterium]
MSIWAIIPARSGSTAIPNKNILAFDGHPLMAYSIAVAKSTPCIERIIVSTDSQEFASLANSYGAETPFLRPKEISGNNATDYECMSHVTNWFPEKEGNLPDLWLYLRPTTPNRCSKTLNKAVEYLSQHPAATSLRSAHKSSESPFKWFLKNRQMLASPISQEFSLEDINTPRQKFPDVYIPNGYIDIVRSKVIQESKVLHGDRVLVFETERAYELDEEDDIEFLDFHIKNHLERDIRVFLNKKNKSKRGAMPKISDLEANPKT